MIIFLENGAVMQKGRVKWFSAAKGYGFIESESKEYFVHFRHILGEGFRALDKDEIVEFHHVDGAKGFEAHKVRVIYADGNCKEPKLPD
jgi:CspA family cold shock protein